MLDSAMSEADDGLGLSSGATTYRWLKRQAILTVQAVMRTATNSLFIAGSRRHERIARKAWTRLSARVPNFVFRGIHISFTKYGAILRYL